MNMDVGSGPGNAYGHQNPSNPHSVRSDTQLTTSTQQTSSSLPQTQISTSTLQTNVNLTTTLSQDDIQTSSQGSRGLTQTLTSTLSNTPTLSNPPSTSNSGNSFSNVISNTIVEHQLPNGNDLSSTLSPSTRNAITQTMDGMEDAGAFDMEMKNFFNLLSKMYPLSLTLLEAMLQGEGNLSPEEFVKQALKELTELGKLLGSLIDSLNLPQDAKDQLKQLAAQLANLGNFSGDDLKGAIDQLMKNMQGFAGKLTEGNMNQMKQLASLLENLANAMGDEIPFDADPELFQKLNDMGLLAGMQDKGMQGDQARQLASQMQQGMMTGDMSKLFQSLSTTLGLLGTLKNMPMQNQNLALSTLMAMQSIESKTNPSGLLGPNLGQFSNNMAKFIMGIQENSGIFKGEVPRGSEGERFYANAFNQTILSAAVLGRMIAASRADVTDDAIKAAVIKLNSAKELGVVDQIPFSFMAFFADLRSDDDDSDAVQSAKKSLLGLIRILLKLIFVLVAIASAGTKLGEKGMNQLLEENSLFITGILDTLIFALKKVDENYVVNVKLQVECAQSGKDALATKNYSEFWISMLNMYSEKTELVQFLKDMEDAKPLFSTIESLMNDSKESLPITMPLGS